ncbi:hypothetical protein AO068_19320 [Pseudomonas sp. ICMP 3272]|nr:hypothetical protein AO068_19320 [Pseudomonas sp. ICMP 3272]KTC56065.1 hypothetical protein AO258_04705 [Pseudomonas syringae ICMP 19498]
MRSVQFLALRRVLGVIQMTIVPMLRVGMHWVTLRVTNLQPCAVSRAKQSQALVLPVSRAGLNDASRLQCDAERHEMHYHAERGNENCRDFSYVFGLFKTCA